MAGTLLDLAKRMERYRKQLPAEVERIKKDVADKISTDLIIVTPVDTSEALSNWQVGINSPPSFPLPAIYPGSRGDTESASTAEAIAHARRVLLEAGPKDRLFVSNVVEHIVPLNNGSSTQAPAGFVERAVLLGRIAVREARIKLL